MILSFQQVNGRNGMRGKKIKLQKRKVLRLVPR
jgi:hypothetical protein